MKRHAHCLLAAAAQPPAADHEFTMRSAHAALATLVLASAAHSIPASCTLPSLWPRLDPTVAATPRAFLVAQSMVHRHATLTRTLWALGIGLSSHAGGLQLKPRNVLVDDHEALLPKQQAKGQSQSDDLALRAASPRAKMSDRIGQGIKCSLALAAEEVEACVLA